MVLGAGEFCVVVVIKLTGLLEVSPIATMALWRAKTRSDRILLIDGGIGDVGCESAARFNS